jgi:thiamine pyrophosphate-dependent acetolactate synthase large subunit-like protein
LQNLDAFEDGVTKAFAQQERDHAGMNGIEYIVQILKQEGLEWLACFPSNPLIEKAAKAGVRPIAFRHERGAVMAADGFSQTSNRKRFGVVAI